MDFLVINGFNVPPGKSRELQEWARANTAAISKSAPEGMEFIGVYAAIFSSEKHSGDVKVVWRMDSYAALDRFSAAVAEGGEFGRLIDELGSFGDVRIGADFSGELLKSMADVTIWADNPEE